MERIDEDRVCALLSEVTEKIKYRPNKDEVLRLIWELKAITHGVANDKLSNLEGIAKQKVRIDVETQEYRVLVNVSGVKKLVRMRNIVIEEQE